MKKPKARMLAILLICGSLAVASCLYVLSDGPIYWRRTSTMLVVISDNYPGPSSKMEFYRLRGEALASVIGALRKHAEPLAVNLTSTWAGGRLYICAVDRKEAPLHIIVVDYQDEEAGKDTGQSSDEILKGQIPRAKYVRELIRNRGETISPEQYRVYRQKFGETKPVLLFWKKEK